MGFRSDKRADVVVCDMKTMLEEEKYSCYRGALGGKEGRCCTPLALGHVTSSATWCTVELGLDPHITPVATQPSSAL